jgi:hypothetical protein
MPCARLIVKPRLVSWLNLGYSPAPAAPSNRCPATMGVLRQTSVGGQRALAAPRGRAAGPESAPRALGRPSGAREPNARAAPAERPSAPTGAPPPPPPPRARPSRSHLSPLPNPLSFAQRRPRPRRAAPTRSPRAPPPRAPPPPPRSPSRPRRPRPAARPRRAPTSATLRSLRTSTTVRRRSSTRCSARPRSSARTRRSPSA